MNRLVRLLASAVAAAAAGVASMAAHAQAPTWPQRNVQFMLPFGAGSATDIAARLLAERLQAALQRAGKPGVISSTLHRDDFGSRGLAGGADPTHLPFEIEGRHIVLIDDVLYTGRTIRAVVNELYDFGRPASVQLAVLVDRGGRQLPIEPAFAAAKVVLPAPRRLSLARAADGRFTFSLDGADAGAS